MSETASPATPETETRKQQFIELVTQGASISEAQKQAGLSAEQTAALMMLISNELEVEDITLDDQLFKQHSSLYYPTK